MALWFDFKQPFAADTIVFLNPVFCLDLPALLQDIAGLVELGLVEFTGVYKMDDIFKCKQDL